MFSVSMTYSGGKSGSFAQLFIYKNYKKVLLVGGKIVHSALPARLLVDNTHAYILTDCEGGYPVSAPGVGGNVPLVTVDLG